MLYFNIFQLYIELTEAFERISGYGARLARWESRERISKSRHIEVLINNIHHHFDKYSLHKNLVIPYQPLTLNAYEMNQYNHKKLE